MCTDDSLFWIEILSVKGVGEGTWLRLGREIGPRRIVSMLRSATGRGELSKLTGKRVSRPDPVIRDRSLSFIEKNRCGAFSIEDPAYPSLLREISQPPPLLFYRGDPGVLELPPICVVGSRAASRRGLLTSRSLAAGLAASGFLVVSGMARGIDSSAHSGALDAGGKTCAVLGCGIDVPYPPENVGLAMEIARSGLVLSEFSPGTPPLRNHFPRRNRILSGLSLGVVVVEACLESGAIGTAGWAADQGREVYAVPGPIEYEGSGGPHRLIREGAYLVECVEDILSALPPCGTSAGARRVTAGNGSAIRPSNTLPREPDEKESKVLAALCVEPKHIDELVQICHISATSILPVLTGLEMMGVVESCGGGTFALAAETGRRSAGESYDN